MEKHDAGEVNRAQEEARLQVREAELRLGDVARERGRASADHAEARGRLESARRAYEEVKASGEKAFHGIRAQIDELDRENGRYLIRMRTAGEGKLKPKRALMRLDHVTRAYLPNQLPGVGK